MKHYLQEEKEKQVNLSNKLGQLQHLQGCLQGPQIITPAMAEYG